MGNEENLNEPTESGVSPNSITNDKEKDEEEKRKTNEIPVDDGSPVNISTLLHACASAKVFRQYSTASVFVVLCHSISLVHRISFRLHPE